MSPVGPLAKEEGGRRSNTKLCAAGEKWSGVEGDGGVKEEDEYFDYDNRNGG